LNGIQEVVGSISSSSTNDCKGLEGFPSKPFFVKYTKNIQIESGVLRADSLRECIQLELSLLSKREVSKRLIKGPASWVWAN